MASTFTLHTLGPEGTNCEAAATHWLSVHGYDVAGVVLHPTLEDGVRHLKKAPQVSALLGCVVYPQLNDIVFQNLSFMELTECFVYPTHPMVLAAREERATSSVDTVAAHPAPIDLVSHLVATLQLVDSNVVAAEECAAGRTDACITTLPGATRHGLAVLEDYGTIAMGFSIHRPLSSREEQPERHPAAVAA